MSFHIKIFRLSNAYDFARKAEDVVRYQLGKKSSLPKDVGTGSRKFTRES